MVLRLEETSSCCCCRVVLSSWNSWFQFDLKNLHTDISLKKWKDKSGAPLTDRSWSTSTLSDFLSSESSCKKQEKIALKKSYKWKLKSKVISTPIREDEFKYPNIKQKQARKKEIEQSNVYI